MDSVAEGYEFDFSRAHDRERQIHNVLSRVNSRSARSLEEYVYPLGAASGSVVAPSGRSVAQQIGGCPTRIRDVTTAGEGRQAKELRFAEGRLKGYRSAAIM